MNVRFIKMQATGNDFLLLDGPLAKSDRASTAKRFCDRRFGFGADGFIVIETSNGQLSWDFYNSDGSEAAMCGNAARAVGLYLCERDRVNSVQFQTKIGTVAAKKVGSEMEVEFQIPTEPPRQLPRHSALWINTGVPHAVILQTDLSARSQLCAVALSVKSDFQKDGINVTFYSPKAGGALEAVTHERGVEDFTLSCGTGALAAARAHLNGQDGVCEVHVPGGKLNVTFRSRHAILRGEASFIGWCEAYAGNFI